MKRFVLLTLVLVACGPKTKGPELAPLPPDDKVDATQQADPPKVEEPPARPVPVGPLDLKIESRKVTAKLLKPGTGKRMPLKVAAKQGATQPVELAFDFSVTQSLAGSTDPNDTQVDLVPTVVLSGKAEAKTAAADGSEFRITVDKTDALETKDSKVPMDKFREVLTSTVGLTIDGKVAANGAVGEIAMHLDKQGEASAQVLDLVRLTLSPWPTLPAEPLGVGGKWQTTSSYKLADRLDVTAVTEFEVVSFKAGVWTIKGTTKMSGADQMMQGGKITKIAGTGTHELTFTDGQLFPTYKSRVETTFSASEAEPKAPNPPRIEFKIGVGGSVTAKP
jgi:hypothetical protein